MDIHPMGTLMRRFVVDWLDRADVSVPPQIMAPEYTIVIAGVEMVGRDAYTEATGGQLARFPGLMLTVHDAIFASGDRAALRFTEHGASARGGSASWRGIGLFRAQDGLLVHNATEEDYLGRRRQLTSGVPDTIDPPMVAPWTEPVADPDPAAERAVRSWLDAGARPVPGIVLDDGGASPSEGARSEGARSGAALLDVESVEITELFSAGRRVAVHAVLHGRYAGGLPELDVAAGAVSTMGLAALLEVAPDGTLSGHVVRDRLGLHRSLGR